MIIMMSTTMIMIIISHDILMMSMTVKRENSSMESYILQWIDKA